MADIYREAFMDGCNETKDTICQILFEGEPTNIGREITIDRIKEAVNYKHWLTINQ